MKYKDKSEYKGPMTDNKRHGKGKMTWPKPQNAEDAFAATYDGYFRDDKFNGKGTYTWKPNFTYNGDWEDGKR